MIRKLCLLLCFVTLITSQDLSDIDLDKLISELFTPSPFEDSSTNTPITQRPITQRTTTQRPITQRPITQIPPTRPTIISTAPPIIEEKPCTGGVCLPYYLCNNTDGENIIDIRIGADDECHYLEVCCPEEETQPKPTIPNIESHEGCGYRNVNGIGFKLANFDSESQYAEFPWMVALLNEQDMAGRSLKTYICGGALIHPQVVLTAAHCVYDKYPNQLIIRVGEWDTQTINEMLPHQDRTVSEIIIHERFYKAALFNDVALLFLTDQVDLAENVGTLCLPPQNYLFDGIRCTASGWGKDVFGEAGRFQVIMKKLEVPIVNRDRCLSSLRTTRLGNRFMLHDSFICAGGEPGKDTCKGDGGSPLVCPIPGTVNRYYQAGIVAWGIGCGENLVPGVYVNIAMFRNWIDTKFSSKGYDTNYYTL